MKLRFYQYRMTARVLVPVNSHEDSRLISGWHRNSGIGGSQMNLFYIRTRPAEVRDRRKSGVKHCLWRHPGFIEIVCQWWEPTKPDNEEHWVQGFNFAFKREIFFKFILCLKTQWAFIRLFSILVLVMCQKSKREWTIALIIRCHQQLSKRGAAFSSWVVSANYLDFNLESSGMSK